MSGPIAGTDPCREPTGRFARRRTGGRSRQRRRLLVFAAAFLVGTLTGAGGAGAAGLLTGKNVRDDSLRSRDFRDGSVTRVRFRDGTLRQADVSFDLSGDKGAPGDPGPAGPPGISALTYRTGPTVSDTTRGSFGVTATCLDGEIALSGGARRDSTPADPATVLIADSGVNASGNAWTTRIAKTPGLFAQYTPVVICAQVPAP